MGAACRAWFPRWQLAHPHIVPPIFEEREEGKAPEILLSVLAPALFFRATVRQTYRGLPAVRVSYFHWQGDHPIIDSKAFGQSPCRALSNRRATRLPTRSAST